MRDTDVQRDPAGKSGRSDICLVPCYARYLFFLPQKALFDFRIDLVEPLLRSLGTVPVSHRLSLQFCNAILSCAKLVRELLSCVHRVSAIFFSDARCFLEQTENGLTCVVELISAARASAIPICVSAGAIIPH